MSFTRVAIYAASPSTTRGQSTKLSASKEKIVYTNGRTVFVSCETFPSLLSKLNALALDTRYRCWCPSTRIHSFTVFTDPVRTPHSLSRTAATSNTRPSHAYLQRATIVLRLMRLEPVRVDFSITAASFRLFTTQCGFGISWVRIGCLRESTKLSLGGCVACSTSAILRPSNAQSNLAMISSGTARVNVSSPLAMGKKSGLSLMFYGAKFAHYIICWLWRWW